MGTTEIYVVFGLSEEQVAMRSVLLLVFFLKKVSFFSEEEKLNPEKESPLFVPLPSIYKRARGFLSSFLSNNGFVSHHYCSSAAVSICHLSCCHFSEMGRLTSDTELINNDIVAVMSFCLTLYGLRL